MQKLTISKEEMLATLLVCRVSKNKFKLQGTERSVRYINSLLYRIDNKGSKETADEICSHVQYVTTLMVRLSSSYKILLSLRIKELHNGTQGSLFILLSPTSLGKYTVSTMFLGIPHLDLQFDL